MKVNQNISAVISNAQLHRTENNLSASIERLSSGFKINKAKDNPAGIAISNKMRAQIEALGQSSRNAADGTSVIQTADGALSETHAMLQRMRELSVQAATDSLTMSDKQACQDEIEALQKEVDRIANDTEFNGKRILDGSQDRRIFPSVDGNLASTYIKNFQSSDEVGAGNYSFKITQAARQAEISNLAVAAGNSNSLKINGVSVEINASDTQAEIYAKLRDAGEIAGVTVEKVPMTTGNYSLTSIEFGSSAKIECILNGVAQTVDQPGLDTKITLDAADSDFNDTATYLSNGKKVTITDLDGYKLVFEVDPETLPDSVINNSEAVDLEVTDIGSMVLQVGAHENQIIDMRIPAVKCETLYIDDLNVVRKDGADKAMAALGDAIAQVSEVRSRLGAYQNRLDYAVTSLDGTEENMEAAISRIMDTDMAEEMSTYSNLNVLDQAAISVLTQANDMPQQVLQLLN